MDADKDFYLTSDKKLVQPTGILTSDNEFTEITKEQILDFHRWNLVGGHDEFSKYAKCLFYDFQHEIQLHKNIPNGFVCYYIRNFEIKNIHGIEGIDDFHEVGFLCEVNQENNNEITGFKFFINPTDDKSPKELTKEEEDVLLNVFHFIFVNSYKFHSEFYHLHERFQRSIDLHSHYSRI